MDKKELGNKLIIISLFLYLSYFILFGILDVCWNINYYEIIYNTSAIMKELILLGYIIIAIINIIASIIIIIGGRWAEVRIDYWLVLIGIIFIINSLSTRWLVSIAEICGIFLHIQYEILLPMMYILISVGIVFVITGGIMKIK